MTWVNKDFSLTGINGVLAKAEGRDKLGRVVQYGTRAIVGFVSLANAPKGSALMELSERAEDVMKGLSSARRVNRWGKEIPVLQQIPAVLRNKNIVDMVLELGAKVTLATFLINDHIAWLKNVKIIKSGRNSAAHVRFALRWFCVSNFLSAIINIKKLANEDESKRGNLLQTILKHMLLVIQTAHLGKIRQTHDSFVGVCGVLSSCIDLKAQWPDAKK